MTIEDKQATPIAAGEELPRPFVPVTQSVPPLQRFWSAANVGFTPGRRGSTLLRHAIYAIIAFLLLTALAANLSSYDNYLLAEMAGSLCAIAGLTVLIGQNGQLSLGHAAIMAIGAYGVAEMQTYFDNHNLSRATWTIFVSLGVGVLAATVVGLAIGLVAARFRGPYLAGVTLALALVIEPLSNYFRSTFNGDQGLSFGVPDPPASLGAAFRLDMWQVWIAGGCAILVLLFLANLTRSRVGRNFRAVRDDEVAARLSGIHLARTQITAFVVSAACAGLGGGVFAMLQLNAQPGAFGLQVSLYLFLAIIVGGLGSLTGAVWGAILITILPEWTKNIGGVFNTSPAITQRLNGNLALALFGAALVVIMIAAPGGVQGLLYRVRRWSAALLRGNRR
jgi:ABC-type branched-subunit amino acid transport system permease subunit